MLNPHASTHARSGLQPDAPAVRLIDARRRFGKTSVLRGVTATLERGTVCGLVGTNGAGKTTLIHSLMGMIPLSAGTAEVMGLDPWRSGHLLRQQIGFFPERDLPYGWMRLRTLLRMAERSFPSWDQALATQVRERFGLDPAQRLREMSKGMVAKAKLLVVLGHRPSLLVLDEPINGLDPVSRTDLLTAVGERAVEGATVLISSHNLDDLDRVVTQVLLLRRGRVGLLEDAAVLRARYGRVTVPRTTPWPAALRTVDGVGGGAPLNDAALRSVLVPDRTDDTLRSWLRATPEASVEPAVMGDFFRIGDAPDTEAAS